MHLPHNPSSPLVSIKPREMKSYIHTKTCMQMFLAALFITVKTENHSNVFSGSTDVWRYNRIILSVNNKQKWLSVTTQQLDQYPRVLLIETNQFQRVTSYLIPFIGYSQNAKFSNGEQISELLGVKGGDGEGMITQKQHQGIFWNDGSYIS